MPALQITSFATSLTAGLALSNTCGPDHIHDAGSEAKQHEHDEPERGRREQTVETPAHQSSDENAGNQLRGEAETERHRRSAGANVSTSSTGLISSDVSAVPKFGQPVLQTSEPCGKCGLVRRRLVLFFAVIR